MSTTFAIYKFGAFALKDDCIPNGYEDSDFIPVAIRHNGGQMGVLNDLLFMLNPNERVYPLDNSAQGIYSVNDLWKAFEEE